MTPSGPQGQAHLLVTGSLAQQLVQVTGLFAMFAIVTVLARRLSLAELGVYGLLTSLAGYLLLVQNAAGAAAVQGMAMARDGVARDTAFSSTVVLYCCAGALGGALLALAGLAVSAPLELSAAVDDQAKLGALVLGVVTLVGWPLTVFRDSLRAEQLFVPAAFTEIAALLAYLALVLGLAYGGADLFLVIGASGSLPLLVGLGCLAVARAQSLPHRLRPRLVNRQSMRGLTSVAGYLSLSEGAAGVIYVVNRALLGIFKSAGTVGLYEGPIRAHNLLRSLNAAVTVIALPTAASYRAEERPDRLAQLLLRGTRYTLALLVPLAVTGMVLSGPILEVWLGDTFREADVAMTILLGHWLVNGCSGLLIAILVGVGNARLVAGYSIAVAVGNVVLAVALIPSLGLEGVALATSVPYLALFPVLVRMALKAAAVPVTRLAREGFIPALSLGLVLAVLLAVLRFGTDPTTVPAVVGCAMAGLLGYWFTFYAVCLAAGERSLVRDVGRGLFPRKQTPGARRR